MGNKVKIDYYNGEGVKFSELENEQPFFCFRKGGERHLFVKMDVGEQLEDPNLKFLHKPTNCMNFTEMKLGYVWDEEICYPVDIRITVQRQIIKKDDYYVI